MDHKEKLRLADKAVEDLKAGQSESAILNDLEKQGINLSDRKRVLFQANKNLGLGYLSDIKSLLKEGKSEEADKILDNLNPSKKQELLDKAVDEIKNDTKKLIETKIKEKQSCGRK